jgi:hypothetical protein
MGWRLLLRLLLEEAAEKLKLAYFSGYFSAALEG